MICSAGKKISIHFAVHIRLPFTPAPLKLHLLHPSLQPCVSGTSSPAYMPKFTTPPLTGWGARDFSLLRRRSWEDVCAGGRNKLRAGSLCFDRLRWRISLLLEPDVVLADAVQASHAALAGLLPSHLRPPPLPAPLPSPPPAQASAYLEQRELSLPDCVVVF